MGLDTYLDRTVFYQPRPFSRHDVIDFILAAGKPFQEMIDLVRAVKDRHGIKIAVLSNEGREIAVDRIQRFALARFVDFFIVSCFVHFRKPDEDIFRVALDVAQATPEGTVYIEDRQMFAEVGGQLGLRSIWHRNVDSTRETLAGMGLDV
jgi:putative hydrolase of the HAD superfamily